MMFGQTPKDYLYEVSWSDEDQAYVASVPDFPGIMARSPTPGEAVTQVQAAMAIALPHLQGALAKVAYVAYGQTTDFKNYQGLPMPAWDDLPSKIQEAWVAATSAAVEAAVDYMRVNDDND